MTSVILMQSYGYPNIWSLTDADTGDIMCTNIDRMARNGAFAADLMVSTAIRSGFDIVGMLVSPNEKGGDTNQDAGEGALYRAAHGAFDN